jgi:hypothetical protein
MSASNSFENSLLLLIFNATAIADIAENPQGSPGPNTHLWVSLHTADPGEAGDQSTNEATYTQYQRIQVLRTAGGWTVSGNSVTNAAEVLFNQATGGTNTITHFGIGRSPTGAQQLYFSGALTSSLAVSNGIQPRFQAGQLTVTAD